MRIARGVIYLSHRFESFKRRKEDLMRTHKTNTKKKGLRKHKDYEEETIKA